MINNQKRPVTQTTEKLASRITNKLPAEQLQKAKQNPLFVAVGVLGFSLLLMLLFFLKSAISSGGADPVKPDSIIIKSQTEYIDEAEAALIKKDYPTFSQFIGSTCVDFQKKSDITDINIPSSKNIPLIVTAAATTNVDALQLLLCEGADVNAANVFTGDTAIMLSAQKGDLESVRALLRAGADLNIKNKYNQTPLLFAIDSQNPSIINILISSGAIEGSSDSNLLFYVNKQNVLGVDSMLKTGARATAKSPQGLPAVTLAATLGNLDIMNLLLTYKADIEASGPDGSTPLLNAAKYKHADMVTFLISKGANVNAQNSFKETPLFWAAFNNTPQIAETLVKAGADPAVTNRDGFTPYKVAEIKQSKETLDVFKKNKIGLKGKITSKAPAKKKAAPKR